MCAGSNPAEGALPGLSLPRSCAALKGATLVAMSTPERSSSARVRREPPRFRRVSVRRIERSSPRLVRVTFAGPELEGMTVDEPAASVRLLLPSPGTPDLVIPTWNGNEFLLPDGHRPTIRTFTPRRVDPDTLEIDLEIVVHGGGVASEWADAAEPGAPAAISGPGRGYTINREAPAFLLAGDETAIPAISQLLERLPADRPAQVHIEVAHSGARVTLPHHPGAAVEWYELSAGAPPGETLLAAVRDAHLDPGTRVWAAGEAAGVQRVRRHLFEDRGLPRAQASVRGYWKRGRSGDTETQ
jgi:NADPH-dependent ferric siderophore reductase